MKQLLSSIGGKARLRGWDLLAYPVAAAAALAASLIPGKTMAYDDPSCPNCYWVDTLRYDEMKWCLGPGSRENCSIVYPNYEYARDRYERVCENQMDICYTCGNIRPSDCCIWLLPESPCCDTFHIECPYELC